MHGYKWPINCTRTQTLKFAFEIIDSDGSGEVEIDEFCGLVKAMMARTQVCAVKARKENVGKSQSCMFSKLRIVQVRRGATRFTGVPSERSPSISNTLSRLSAPPVQL